MYHLDTDITVYAINGRSPQAVARMQLSQPGDIAVSTIVVAELEFAIAKSSRGARTADGIARFLRPLQIVPFGESAAIEYGKLRAYLERTGQVIGAMDMLIAAIALAEDATLVTNNVREFQRVPGLRIENWNA